MIGIAELLDKSIALLNAIEQDNRDEAIDLVNYLNNNFEPLENMQQLNEIIPLGIWYNQRKDDINETFKYVLNNLQFMSNMEQLQWFVRAQSLMIEGDKNILSQFVVSCLDGDLYDYQLSYLIQICVTIDRYDLLNALRNKIPQLKTKEE
jgi:hypothetical protein